MARYRHYKNLVPPGGTGFFTTTCLDMNHALARQQTKDLLCLRICDDCTHYRAILHGFAVMSNHFHVIITMPSNMTGSVFIQRLKEHSAKDILSRVDRS